MSYTVTLTADGTTGTQSGTEVEYFKNTITLPGSASDTSLTLGTLTDPTVIAVFGATGISFKLGSGGTDSIKANPFAAIADADGIGESVILLSNGDASEQTVTVIAAEE